MALKVDASVGDVILIDEGRITITVEDKSGKRSRLSVDAPKGVSIRKVTDYAKSVDSKPKSHMQGLSKSFSM